MVESISPLFSPAWEASNKAQPTSMDFALRYPEPTAQPTARNMQRAAPPPHPSAETYSLPNSAQAYPSSTSLNSLSVSGTRSVSPGERRGSCMSSRQNRGHADPAVRYSIERPSSHTPQRCYGSRNSSFVDPEKASYAPNSVSSGFHSHHAHSICLSEDEEDVKDHTVWILVSQPL